MSTRITEAMVEAAEAAFYADDTISARSSMRAALEAALSTEPGEAEGWDELSRLREVERAAQTFVDKLKLCHDDERYRSVWTIAHLHIGAYTGPQYADELNALDRALSERKEGQNWPWPNWGDSPNGFDGPGGAE